MLSVRRRQAAAASRRRVAGDGAVADREPAGRDRAEEVDAAAADARPVAVLPETVLFSSSRLPPVKK